MGEMSDVSKFLPAVYAELRRLAAHYMRGERDGHTLQPTALINEAYIRLASQGRGEWSGKSHFVASAAHLMRQVLVDYAKAHNADKRGGGQTPIPLDDALIFSPEKSNALLVLNDALERLEKRDARQSRIVELRFFGGLTVEGVAEVLGVSPSTVRDDWRLARAWLHREIETGQ
jgi:RNA polymerase sigma-70 factor, ECF subfamily